MKKVYLKKQKNIFAFLKIGRRVNFNTMQMDIFQF